MIRMAWIAILASMMLFLVSCQNDPPAKEPLTNEKVKQVLHTIPDHFKKKLRLPTHLPFNPTNMEAHYSSLHKHSYQQDYVQNTEHVVYFTITESTSTFNNLEKIKLTSEIDAFYEEKGILYWNDKKNHVHYLLSTVDHSKQKQYKLSKEQLVKIATSAIPLE
ncbi:hypothetical protein EDC32_1011169 [Laceyella sacchari]|uniref:hypothetical protein n=1 Tax=Laceyella sacchari TaxID=37482 RepID=UPI001049DEF1|nr:hypothetical protein [Laceyella sacchari]TCW41503.1 hypothetical protein EDC32_1011169 [Laceyella sacchari]